MAKGLYTSEFIPTKRGVNRQALLKDAYAAFGKARYAFESLLAAEKSGALGTIEARKTEYNSKIDRIKQAMCNIEVLAGDIDQLKI